MLKKKLIEHYSNPEIQQLIYEFSNNREVAYRYRDNFGKRPNIINLPSDIKKEAEKGMTSIHDSIELWEDPLLLANKKTRIDDIRIGFDLVIDIDFKDLYYSLICTKSIIKFLENYKIENITIKYSGNKGFHIGISWESFPKTYKGEEVRKLFPELPKTILEFIFNKTYFDVAKNILVEEGIFYRWEDAIRDILNKIEINKEAINNLKVKNAEDFKKVLIKLSEKIIKSDEEEEKKLEKLAKILTNYTLLPKLDSIVITNRHLIRSPYSYNEKSGLISIPVKKEEILKLNEESLKDFILENAKIGNVRIEGNFLDKKEKSVRILNLIEDAYNWKEKENIKRSNYYLNKLKEIKVDNRVNKKVPKELFPPCIKNILNGLEDGKKRALFILMNFLFFSGYSIEEIEKEIWEWNERNKEKLKENYIKSQLKWFSKIIKQNKYYKLPNCDREEYYKDIGICKPDDLCKKIKNPMSYLIKKLKLKKKNKK